MNTKHTPLPWHCTACDATVYGPTPHENPGQQHIIAEVVACETDTETMANAEFIVRACNSHEELLKWANLQANQCDEWAARMGRLGDAEDAARYRADAESIRKLLATL